MLTRKRSAESTNVATTASSGPAKKCNPLLVGESSTRIFDLPQDIFHKLFNEYLSMRELLAFDSSVCNRADRSKYLALLATLTIKSYFFIRNHAQLRGIHLRQLRLEVIELDAQIDQSASLLSFPLHWPSIKEWHFTHGPDVSARQVVQCLSKCTSLETLTLGHHKGFEIEDNDLDDERKYAENVLKVFEDAAFCDHLRCVKFVSPKAKLDKRLSWYSSPESVKALMMQCRNLTNVDFGLCLVPSSLMIQLFMVCGATLESFSLDIDVEYIEDPFTKQHLAGVFQYCPRLQSVSLDKDSYTIDALVEIGRHCPDLLTLDVQCHDGSLTDDALIAIFENCRKLKELDLLDTKSSFLVSDRAIIKASECCPNLNSVALQLLGTPVTVKSLESLARNCPLMEELFVGGFEITENEMLQFGMQHSFPNLRKFTSYDNQVCDRFILELSRKSPMLQVVRIYSVLENTIVTSAGMKHIATYCRNLTRLVLCGLSGVTDPESLIEIVKNNPGLKKSSFSFSPPIASPANAQWAPKIVAVKGNGHGCDVVYTKKLEALLQSRE